jgi:mono/diheme cytochrome c family protein
MVSAAILAVMSSFSLAAQTSEPHPSAKSPERASVEGAVLFAAYCASCHGKDGKGPGPASAGKIRVPDLQLLAGRNKGVFPLPRVEALLSGTTQAPIVHGGMEMPLWGAVLSGGDSDRSTRDLRVHALARYLETLQK